MTRGTHCEMTIGSFLSETAEKEPGKIYLHYGDERLCYAEFVNNVRKAARAFQELGIGKGDKVCLLLPNCPEFLYAWLGLAQVGAISVFVNTALKRPEIRYIANHSEAKAIITTSLLGESLPLRNGELPYMTIPPLCVDQSALNGSISFSEVFSAAPAEFEQPDVRPDDVTAFIYTSGTTGLPKAVMQTHQTYVLTGKSIPLWLGLNPQDRLFTCLPLFHINAQAYSVMGSLGARVSLILSEKFSATSFWSQIRNSGAREVNLIGAMPLLLLQQPHKAADRVHCVRLVYTAPALSKEAHEEFESRFGVTLTVGYGMSESTFGCINPLTKDKRKVGSIGLPRAHPDPRFGNRLRLLGEDGQEVANGETGEIVLQNATVMKGYY